MCLLGSALHTPDDKGILLLSWPHCQIPKWPQEHSLSPECLNPVFNHCDLSSTGQKHLGHEMVEGAE